LASATAELENTRAAASKKLCIIVGLTFARTGATIRFAYKYFTSSRSSRASHELAAFLNPSKNIPPDQIYH
ncbi:MAG: hypothetical protein ACKN9V_06175, partial [Pseudomonadota bacterium]